MRNIEIFAFVVCLTLSVTSTTDNKLLLNKYVADFMRLEDQLWDEVEDTSKEKMLEVTLLRQYEKFYDKLEQVFSNIFVCVASFIENHLCFFF